MNTDDRTRLRRFISNHRDSWDDAGIEAALVKLDQQFPNEPLRVAVIALQAACNPQARTPAAMCRPEVLPQPKPKAVTPSPASFAEWCDACQADTARRLMQDGSLMCARCWVDRQTDVTAEPFRRSGVHPPSPEVREKVQQAVGPQKRQQREEQEAVRNG